MNEIDELIYGMTCLLFKILSQIGSKEIQVLTYCIGSRRSFKFDKRNLQKRDAKTRNVWVSIPAMRTMAPHWLQSNLWRYAEVAWNTSN